MKMNVYLTTSSGILSSHSSSGGPTVTVTSVNPGKEHFQVQVQPPPPPIVTQGTISKLAAGSSGGKPSPNVSIGGKPHPNIGGKPHVNLVSKPNVNIGGKRSRVNSKDKESKKLLVGSDNGGSGPSSASVKKEISLDSDLRNMMHAFGDSCSPLTESIRLMESVLKQELQGFVYVCDSIAAMSGAKTLGLQEPIFAIRNEKSRLIRLLKYFAIKDQQQKLQRMNQISQGVVAPAKSYLEEIRQILDRLDESGEFSRLLDSEFILEPTKMERALRADKISQKISYPKYFAYSKARSVSFARKIGNLQDWVTVNTRSEFKMGANFIDVLSFLAYEIVSQIIDLAFMVRRENIPTTNPIQRLSDARATNPDTCMSAPAFQKRKDDQCNSVSEILVQASELEAKRLKKVASNNKEVLVSKNMLAITANEIGEAYSRFQRCVPPPLSYKVRAEKLRRLNHQY